MNLNLTNLNKIVTPKQYILNAYNDLSRFKINIIYPRRNN